VILVVYVVVALCSSVFGGALGYHFTCYLFYACAALHVVVHLLTVCASPYVVVHLLNVLFVVYSMVCAAPYVVVVARADGSILHSLALGDPHTGRWAKKMKAMFFCVVLLGSRENCRGSGIE
jgi:hypothetical protein